MNLYDRPVNVFVAGFIGSPAMNIVDAAVSAEGAILGGLTVPLSRSGMSALQREGARTVTLGFRPESVQLVGEGQGIPMQVDLVEELGSVAYAYGRLAATDTELRATDTTTTVRVDPRNPPAIGKPAYLRIRTEEQHLFSPSSGLRIGD
jgi:multiple sugar transport system ATP-binding protein